MVLIILLGCFKAFTTRGHAWCFIAFKSWPQNMKTAGIMGGGFLYSWTCSWIAHYILYILNKWIWHVLRQFYYKCLIVWYHEFSQNFAMQTKIIWTVLTHNHGAIQTDTPLVTMIYLSDPGQTWLQWSVKKWEMEEKKEGNVRLPAKKKKTTYYTQLNREEVLFRTIFVSYCTICSFCILNRTIFSLNSGGNVSLQAQYSISHQISTFSHQIF